MRKLGIFFLLAIVWFGAVFFLCPSPSISLDFRTGDEAVVRQMTNEKGHLCLEVTPKQAAANFSAMTVAGIPVFPRDWLVANVASTMPLGESEIVDFPRLFNLLPKLFLLGRITIAALPLGILFLFVAIRYGVPILGRICGRRTFLVVLFASTALSFPEPIVDSSPGLDPSWGWFLCKFAFRNVFGSDVVFTYGPLGFLLCPQVSWACVLCALAANIAFAALWIRLLLRVYGRFEAGRLVSWLLMASAAIPVSMEWRWTMLAVLHAVVPMFPSNKEDRGNKEDWALVDWCISGVLAAVISLMKFSSLTIVLGSQLFCLVAFAFRQRRNAMRAATAFVGIFFVTLGVLSALCFESFGAWGSWIRGSMATASGYNLYMVAEKPWAELLVPVLLMGVCVVAVGWRHCFLFAPILFLTVKYAWVRQTSGPLAYAVALLSEVCLLDDSRRVKRVIALGMIALFLNIALALPSALSGLADLQSVSGIKPLAFWHTLILPVTVQSSLDRSAESVERCKLPPAWRDRIGTAAVVFLPHEHAPAMADETLNVKPLPSLQLYSACHPLLDGRNADFFENHVPDFVICEIGAGSAGHFINYPRMWTALLENYECVGDNGRFVLMTRRRYRRKRPEPALAISPEISVWEKIRGVFLRNPVEYVSVENGAGKVERFQFVRGNQGWAFPLAWIPFDDADERAILSGGEGRTVAVHCRRND